MFPGSTTLLLLVVQVVSIVVVGCISKLDGSVNVGWALNTGICTSKSCFGWSQDLTILDVLCCPHQPDGTGGGCISFWYWHYSQYRCYNLGCSGCLYGGWTSSLYLNLGCSGGLATLVVLTRPSPGVVFTLVVAATSGLVTGLALVGFGFVVVVLLTEGAR